MNKDKWDACTDPAVLLQFLRGRAADRKLLQFAAACCRRAWPGMTDPRHRQALTAAERFIDGEITQDEFTAALRPVVGLWARLPDRRQGWTLTHYLTAVTRNLESGRDAPHAARYVAMALAGQAGAEESPAWAAARQAEEAAQCHLLRDLVGDPSRPFQFPPAWLAGEGRAAVAWVRDADRDGRWDSLAALADVLERAGCHDPDVLEHCRGPGPHARGCWVLDALRGHPPAVRTGLVTDAAWRACGDPEPLLHVLRQGGERRWRLFAVACCRRLGPLLADGRSRRAVAVAERYAEGVATAAELEAARPAAQEAEDEARRAEYAAEAEAGFRMTPAYAAAGVRWFAAAAARSVVGRDPRAADGEPGSPEARRWRPCHEWAVAAVGWQVYATSGSVQGDARWPEVLQAKEAAEAAERRAQCDLLRCLFGASLGPVGEAGEWLPWGRQEPRHRRTGAEQWCLVPTPLAFALRPEWLAWNGGGVVQLAQAIAEEAAFDRLPILADALEEAGCTDPGLVDHLRGPGPHVRGCWALDLLLGKEAG